MRSAEIPSDFVSLEREWDIRFSESLIESVKIHIGLISISVTTKILEDWQLFTVVKIDESKVAKNSVVRFADPAMKRFLILTNEVLISSRKKGQSSFFVENIKER